MSILSPYGRQLVKDLLKDAAIVGLLGISSCEHMSKNRISKERDEYRERYESTIKTHSMPIDRARPFRNLPNPYL